MQPVLSSNTSLMLWKVSAPSCVEIARLMARCAGTGLAAESGRDRAASDDAVARQRGFGDGRGELLVDVWLRFDQNCLVEHVVREVLERIVVVHEAEVSADLNHR